MSLKPYYRALGNTGLKLSPLGLGTVKIGRNQGVKYPTGFELPDDNAVRNLLAQAHDLGINLLDTAPAYGKSEERLGPLLKGQREQWLICSKVGEEFTDGQSSFDFSAAHTRYSIERSLKRLGTDYLDMVLVHSDGNDMAILEQTDVYPTLLELKAAGLIRAIGFSGKTLAGGIAALQDGDCAMVTFNLNEQGEQGVLDYAAAHHKGILIKKALASGHVCLQDGQDPVQASFELILRQPSVSSVIVGTITPAHLSHNVTTACQVLARLS
ncbi:Predicted oxidoreductase [Atopomonas hussainii]|uniref:Predicted oxidoreductase n=1 Tax=Atopomonas hussainii TaxID=1429083 RepID=A0A1H7M1X7_9GAMM|nr:aldo/keto reductase [Atopomonas hussainii]SEL05102.1 Predicted oxidoreductase [Atopomonas hussainii]